MPSILGFSAYSSPSRTGIKTYKVPGTDVTIPVRAEVAPLLVGFAKEFHETVEPLVRGWCWGYAYRAIRGAIAPSRHSAGIAIDLNAPRHPLGSRGTFNARQRAQIRALCRKYGLRWGGDYAGRADEMHFEINESRASSLSRVRRLQAAASHSHLRTPTPAASKSEPVLKRGAKGEDVMRWQKGLRHCGWEINPDGDFGWNTRAATIAFQEKVGRAYVGVAYGIVGPKSWYEMKRRVHNL